MFLDYLQMLLISITPFVNLVYPVCLRKGLTQAVLITCYKPDTNSRQSPCFIFSNDGVEGMRQFTWFAEVIKYMKIMRLDVS